MGNSGSLSSCRSVLGTPESNLARYIEEYEASWIVAGTPEAIARVLHTVLETSPQDLDAVGDRTRSLVRHNFRWPSLTQWMTKICHEAVE